MSRDEIVNRLAISEINRPVEIVFLNNVLNFSTSIRYPTSIQYVDESEFYVVIQSSEKLEAPPNDNALKGEQVTIYPMGTKFKVQSSFYEPSFGHLLRFSNSGIPLRRFLRIALNKRACVSLIGDDNLPREDTEGEDIEVRILNLSGSGAAIRCPSGVGLTHGTLCELKIPDTDFPGYDPYQGIATLKGEVVRVFSDGHQSNWENLGIQFTFDNASEEFRHTHLIGKFCRRIAFPESQDNKELQEIMDLTAEISSSLDIDTVLFKINASAARLVSAEVSSILLFDDGKLHLEFKIASGDKAPILSRIRVTQDTGGIAWWVAQTGEPAIVNNIDSDSRLTSTFDTLTGFQTKNLLAVPVIWQGDILGVLEAANKLSETKFTQFDLQLLTTLANQIAVVIKNAQMTEKYENFFTNTIELIVKAIESVGILMGLMSPGHCWRVAALANTIGEQFGITDTAFDDLYYGAALHDIGLLELQNPKPFQFDDYDVESNFAAGERIKSHPVMGANMVKGIQLLQGTRAIIRHHHERFDGMGYPEGLSGEALPLGARIVAVIEAYEEMLYGREDDPSAQKQAIASIANARGTRFDPEVVEVFINQLQVE